MRRGKEVWREAQRRMPSEHRHTERGGSHVMTKTETAAVRLHTKEDQALSVVTRSWGSMHGPADALISDFRPPELLLSAPQLVVLHYIMATLGD